MNAFFKCPYSSGSCNHIDTSDMTKPLDCDQCERFHECYPDENNLDIITILIKSLIVVVAVIMLIIVAILIFG